MLEVSILQNGLFSLQGSEAEPVPMASRNMMVRRLGLDATELGMSPCRVKVLPALTVPWLCCVQVIQATIEKHKQNSETFRAFGSAWSQDEDPCPSPESPVSWCLGQGWG